MTTVLDLATIICTIEVKNLHIYFVVSIILHIDANLFYLFIILLTYFLASEQSERDTLRSVQLRIADIYYILYIVRANFVLITHKEGGA